MIEQYAAATDPKAATAIEGLRDPQRVDVVLDRAAGALALFDAALHNTVTPTVVRASSRIDAVPDTVELDLDGRALPGCTPEQLLAELQSISGIDATSEVIASDEPTAPMSDISMLPALARALQALDPGAVIVPMLTPGVTDGRFFKRLGIQHHGFLPMQLPDVAATVQTMHGVDERVAISALEFGANVYEHLPTTPLSPA
jgi:acetylornithine deacetylase/succinyl-diaminopimelate desuccinylase-like protein